MQQCVSPEVFILAAIECRKTTLVGLENMTVSSPTRFKTASCVNCRGTTIGGVCFSLFNVRICSDFFTQNMQYRAIHLKPQNRNRTWCFRSTYILPRLPLQYPIELKQYSRQSNSMMEELELKYECKIPFHISTTWFHWKIAYAFAANLEMTADMSILTYVVQLEDTRLRECPLQILQKCSKKYAVNPK